MPDSRTPRRFISVRATTSATAISTRWWPMNGIAEAAFATAEEIDTATVST